jgi:predicted membrane channel-forming protein YqfA (hemolysin III family)
MQQADHKVIEVLAETMATALSSPDGQGGVRLRHECRQTDNQIISQATIWHMAVAVAVLCCFATISLQSRPEPRL